MIFCLYGPDSYRRREKLTELLAPYKNKYDNTDIREIDFEETDDAWKEARDFLNQPSMFVDSKVLVAKNGTKDQNKEWAVVLKSHLKRPKSFIFLYENETPSGDFSFLLKPPTQKKEFAELYGHNLEIFVREEAGRLGLIFKEVAEKRLISTLSSFKENRSWRAVMALQKLSLAFPKGTPIEEEGVSIYVRNDMKEEVFSFAKTILYGVSIASKINAFEKFLLQKESSAHLFNLMSLLAKGSSAIILADHDVAVKSGKIGYEEAILDVILSTKKIS